MMRDRTAAIQTGLCVVLVVSWLGYMGYSVWRDHRYEKSAEEFKAKMAKRAEDIKQRLDEQQWEAEI